MERTVTYPESKQADHKQAIYMPGDFKQDLRHHSAMSTSLLTMMLLAACSNGSNNRGIESGGSPAGVVAPVFTSPEIGLVDEDETDFSHRFVATSDVARDTVTYSITGGTGNDWVDGGTGFDTLTGGAGADVFGFSVDDIETGIPQNQKTITDFSRDDRINFSDNDDDENFDMSAISIRQSNGNTYIDYRGSQFIQMTGYTGPFAVEDILVDIF